MIPLLKKGVNKNHMLCFHSSKEWDSLKTQSAHDPISNPHTQVESEPGQGVWNRVAGNRGSG